MASDGGARTRPGSAPATENGQRPRAWSAPVHAAYLTGHAFLPALIAAPFSRGLDIAFDFAIAACLVAALASLLRGRRYVHEEHGPAAGPGHGTRSAGYHLEGGQRRVGRVRDPAAVGHHLAQGRHRLGRDELARCQHRDARRVGRDQFRADPADGGRIAYAADPTLATFQVVTG